MKKKEESVFKLMVNKNYVISMRMMKMKKNYKKKISNLFVVYYFACEVKVKMKMDCLMEMII